MSDVVLLDANHYLDYCWQAIRRCQNAGYLEKMLVGLHSVPEKHKQNARKQASQIRHCLIQALEYFNAAKSVSIATKPVLLYYSVMSFALAEIMLKQSGESSLDKARETHKHHGLTFAVQRLWDTKSPLEVSAASLTARPATDMSGKGYGTFELWHRSARPIPTVAISNNVYSGRGGTQTVRPIVAPPDERSALIDSVSLLDCVRALPKLELFLHERQLEPLFVRGFATEHIYFEYDRAVKTVLDIVLHPTSAAVLERAIGEISVEGRGIEHLTYDISGGAAFIRVDLDHKARFGLQIPSAISFNAKEAYFFAHEIGLNEMGFYYVALFILGNFARYYPDRWMKDVEDSSELAIAAYEICALAERRVPMLCASELTRKILMEKVS